MLPAAHRGRVLLQGEVGDVGEALQHGQAAPKVRDVDGQLQVLQPGCCQEFQNGLQLCDPKSDLIAAQPEVNARCTFCGCFGMGSPGDADDFAPFCSVNTSCC